MGMEAGIDSDLDQYHKDQGQNGDQDEVKGEYKSGLSTATNISLIFLSIVVGILSVVASL